MCMVRLPAKEKTLYKFDVELQGKAFSVGCAKS